MQQDIHREPPVLCLRADSHPSTELCSRGHFLQKASPDPFLLLVARVLGDYFLFPCQMTIERAQD